ncbi:MAG: mechanosensitive ion channel family protein [Clostridiales bacterium]|nr:mechanosensitive ion channel family protein [Clostridiales bacterium]
MDEIINWVLSPKPYLCLAVLVVCFIVWIALRRFVKKIIGKSDKKNGVVSIILNIVKYFLITLCILVILQINGIDVTSAIAGLGIASVIVGLALQDALKDIIMGVNIISEDFFHLGDIVKVGDYSGKITSLTLKSTHIVNSEDGYEVSICNRNIDKVLVYNGTMNIDVQLSYQESPDKIKEVLTQVVKEITDWKEVRKAEYIGIQEYQDSAILYRVRFIVAPSNRATVRRRVLALIDSRLRENDITIPFPQLDVHTDD